MKEMMLVLLGLVLLCGCQNQPLPTISSAASPAAAPRTVDAARFRQVLATGSASIWGVALHNGSLTRVTVYSPSSVTEKWSPVTTSGNGEFTKLSGNRFLFEVPAGQALVINEINGRGIVNLNGYPVMAKQYETDASNRIHYVFGPGEQVVVQISPDSRQSTSDWNYNSNRWSYTLYSLAISGYTIDPDLLIGGGAAIGSSK